MEDVISKSKRQPRIAPKSKPRRNDKIKAVTEDGRIITTKRKKMPVEYKIYEEEMTEFSKMCLENPSEYSSRHEGTYSINMSPATLFYYFKSPEEIDRLRKSNLNKPFYMGNSDENRDPSKKGDLLKVRMKYGYMGIIGVSDFNFFPASLVDTSDGISLEDFGEYGYTHLQLKDRGNLTSIIKRYDEAILTINEWDRLIKKIEEDSSYEHKLKNPNCRKIIDGTKEILKGYTKEKDRTSKRLSLKEVLTSGVFNEWYYNDKAVNLRVRFETFGIHCEEMRHYNNTELGWCQYNHLQTDLGVMSRYNPDEYDPNGLSKVHSLCQDEDVFLGCKTFLSGVQHTNKEGFESWFPIDYTACEELAWKEFINQITRSSKEGTKVKICAWRELLKSKDADSNFIMSNKCGDNIELIKSISELPEVGLYEDTLSTMIKNNHNLDINNVINLTLKKHFNVAIVVRAVKEISKFIHKQRDSVTRRVTIAQEFLTDCKKHMEDGRLDILTDKKISSTVQSRYDNFFNTVIKKTKKRLDKPNDFNSDDFWLDLKTELAKNSISVDVPLSVYDRTDFGVWVERDIDFTKKDGMDDCHRDGKKTKTKKNMFVHLSENNQKVQKNKPIKDMGKYMDEINDDLNDWHTKNGGGMNIRVHNTLILNKCVLDVYKKVK